MTRQSEIDVATVLEQRWKKKKREEKKNVTQGSSEGTWK